MEIEVRGINKWENCNYAREQCSPTGDTEIYLCSHPENAEYATEVVTDPLTYDDMAVITQVINPHETDESEQFNEYCDNCPFFVQAKPPRLR